MDLNYESVLADRDSPRMLSRRSHPGLVKNILSKEKFKREAKRRYSVYSLTSDRYIFREMVCNLGSC